MTAVIYHSRCPDGIMAAWCFHELSDVEFFPASYGWEPPDVTGKDVYIVDFSYPREVLETMKTQAKSLIVLDHHKTSEVALKGLDYCVFDMSRSGAQITWDYLNPEKSRPPVIDYVGDRDLWTWALPESKNVNTYLSAIVFDPRQPLEKVFERLNYLVANWDLGLISDNGVILSNLTESYVAQLAVNTFSGDVDYTVNNEVRTQNLIVCVCSILQSDVGNYLATKHQKPVLLMWLKNTSSEGEVWGCSLRNYDQSPIDLSEIATSYGGGGHRNACGFGFTGSIYNLVKNMTKIIEEKQ